MSMLPQIDFCGKSVSGLIVRGNPFSGNSHRTAHMDAGTEDFFTAQRIRETLFSCLRNGINTAQMRGDRHIMRMLREFRLEGGEIHWIGQTAPEIPSMNRTCAWSGVTARPRCISPRRGYGRSLLGC